MVNRIKITYFPLIDNHRTALFYPTDSCRCPLKDILIATRADLICLPAEMGKKFHLMRLRLETIFPFS
jgi:hypothetical protein